MTKEKRLGRGLEALLGKLPDGYGDDAAPATPQAGDYSNGGLLQVNVYQIDGNPFQPRHDFDDSELDSLAESLRQHGLLQPIALRRMGDRYQLVAGERRLRAAIKAGWQEVPAHLIEADDRQVAELAIVENLQRRDLNPLEKAASFQDYLQRYQCSQDELAGRLQMDRSTVANLIRLLELPEEVQKALRSGAVTQGHARALLPLGDEREQVALCQQIQDQGLSVRAVESIVQDTIARSEREELGVVDAPEAAKKRPAKRSTGQLAALEQELRGVLGTKVEIRTGAKGRGKIIVHFTTHDEFERLRDLLHATTAQDRKAG
ncbi:MAG TPA: ParB/RepB/Spo0J family partition protein [Pirellulales bacterium]|nr:ParB/RepB/Spo0J family partition protein [Pirellulales bacterium]